MTHEERSNGMEETLMQVRLSVARIEQNLGNHLAHHESKLKLMAIIIAPLTAFAVLGLQVLAKSLGWL